MLTKHAHSSDIVCIVFFKKDHNAQHRKSHGVPMTRVSMGMRRTDQDPPRGR